MSGTVAAGWLLQTALGGGLLLLLARLVMARAAEPALRQRLGELGVLSALLLGALALGPAWLPITLPAWMVPASPAAQSLAGSEQALAEPAPAENAEPDSRPANVPDGSLAEEQPAAASAPPHQAAGIETVLVVVYAAVAGLFVARWLFAHVALAWLLRGAERPPAKVLALLDEMRPRRRPRVLMAPRVRAPFSYGLFRPTMVLPARLVDAPPQVLRWVLAHEQSHLDRRDSWAGLLLALGQAVFFCVPWFWGLRRQVRLCQEQVADAAAVRAGGSPADYAEFLLGWTGAAKTPLVGTGVFGSSSDLYQRVAQLLQGPATAGSSRPRRWLVAAAAGLLCLAVVLPGLHVRMQAAAPPPSPHDSTPDSKNEEAKKEEPPARLFGDVDQLLDRLPAGTDAARIKELRDRLEAMRQRMEREAERMQRLIDRQGLQRLPWFEPQRQRLGALVAPAGPTLAAQLDLQKGQGMVLEEVGPNSAAAKAGMRAHDILLELNGKPVPSKKEDFVKLLESVKAKTPVDAVVVRKRRRLTINGLMLPEAKQSPAPFFGNGVDKLDKLMLK